MVTVRTPTAADLGLLTTIGAAGFEDDPVMSWIFPDEATRLDKLHLLFGGLVRDMLDAGVVRCADDACVALWREPGFAHGRTAADRADDATADAGDDGPPPFRPDELERLGLLGETMSESHPHDPHWYLNVIATLPDRRGRGLGTAVLQPMLDRCDRDAVPAYLESTNPRNHSLYHRLGFVDTDELVVPGGPSLMAMWRQPRRPGST